MDGFNLNDVIDTISIAASVSLDKAYRITQDISNRLIMSTDAFMTDKQAQTLFIYDYGWLQDFASIALDYIFETKQTLENLSAQLDDLYEEGLTEFAAKPEKTASGGVLSFNILSWNAR